MKITTILSASVLMLALLQSCTKQPLVVYKTMNVSLKQNETFQFDLGNVQSVEITKQASHFQTSQLQYSNPEVYTYIPSKDYAGTDDAELTIGKGPQNSCGFGGGSCNPHNGNQAGSGFCGQDDQIIYTLHFSIEGNTGKDKPVVTICPSF